MKSRILLALALFAFFAGVSAADQLPEPSMGDPNAPVVMTEFADFQCPFCGRFNSDTFPLLKKEFIDTGKVRFVYRDFPLDFHEQAQSAAEAAQCAHEQENFWGMHDRIFANQQILGRDAYRQWAQELGLDTGRFNECLDTHKYYEEVQEDFSEGEAKGINGTPTFFINGEKLVGAQPYEQFKRAILGALGEEPQNPVPEPKPPQPAPEPEEPVDMEELVQGAHLLYGDPSVKIVMVEFSDFECPFCKKAHPIIRELAKKYSKDLAVYYKHFPLSFHQDAMEAAIASECAAEQGAFRQYHDVLFENQQSLDYSSLKKYAELLSLDTERFNACLDSQSYAAKVEKDFEQGTQYGVSGTPTFFVNGEKIVGAQPQENFEAMILKFLGKEYVVAPKQPQAPLVVLPNTEDQPVEQPPAMPEIEPECTQGETTSYTCPGGKKVNWCTCLGGEWECVESPQTACLTQEPATCSGCNIDGQCMGVSSRFFLQGKESYCGLDLQVKEQKNLGESCQNNFECQTNSCGNGQCVDLQKEIAETKGILQQVLDWLSGLFGFKPQTGQS